MHAVKPLCRTFAPFLAVALPLAAHAQSTATYADVAPIFDQHCVLCHSGSKPAAGLRLDALDTVLKGGAKGPVAKAGAPAEGELVRRIMGISQPRMPMTSPPFLSDNDVATIERWIAGGLDGHRTAAEARKKKRGRLSPTHRTPDLASGYGVAICTV